MKGIRNSYDRDICRICNINLPKYKCPNCQIAYCSSSCYKSHKINPCKTLTDKIQQQQEQHNDNINNDDFMKTDYIEDQSLRLPQQSLKKIKSNKKILQLLNNKHLRDQIQKIDDSRRRIGDLQSAMMENQNDFMVFVQEILSTLAVRNSQGQLI